MNDNQPAMPGPPPGMQRPGIPGAGNILDPEVRGEIREKLHPAVHEAVAKARGQQTDGSADAAEPVGEEAATEKPAGEKTATRHQAGPYPHGDVDLSYIAANVPTDPVKPRRAKAGRRFYFLPAEEAKPTADVPVPGPNLRQPPAGPKPG